MTGTSAPVGLGAVVNSAQHNFQPCVFANGLILFFASERLGGYGRPDIYVTKRATTSDPWEEPVNLGPWVNDGGPQCPHYLAPDGSTFYFDTGAPGYGGLLGYDFWQAPIIPTVDLNADGIVDAADVCAIVDHWGEDFPLCDIGPTPLGDGTVDVQDLIALSEHLFETVTLPASPASYGSFTEGPAGTYTMTDRGGDIWDSSDQFHFAYKMLTGPGSIVARIDSLTNTDPWAKAGVMIRETLERSAKHALVCVTAGNGVAFRSRSDTWHNSIDTHETGITAPWWVKLERDAQGKLTAAQSRDGITWTSVYGAPARSIPMNPEVYIGLALSGYNDQETCQAVFSNVTITGNVTSQWADQAVGPFGQP